MLRLVLLAFVASSVACTSSPVDPFPDIVAETLGTDFTLADQHVDVPLSVANLSTDATYYVWMGPGGICTSVDRLGPRGWAHEGNDACYPASMVAVRPGERVDSQVTFFHDRTGMFRLRIHVSDKPVQTGYSSGGEPIEPTNAFRISPEA